MKLLQLSKGLQVPLAGLVLLLLLAGCGGGNGGGKPIVVVGPSYRLTDISNGLPVGAAAINNAGQVLVTSFSRDFVPALSAASRSVRKAAASRDVVPTYAFLYSGGRFMSLTIRLPVGLNDEGVLVGDGGVGGADSQQTGTFVRIPALGPASTSLNFETYPYAVNNAGQVAGASIVPQDPNAPYTGDNSEVSHAFLYAGGQVTDLGTLSEPPSPSDPQTQTPAHSSSAAFGINNQGQVVGVSSTVTPASGGAILQHAFVYSGGKMTDLGTLGGISSVAASINSQGQIAGYAVVGGTSETHAALWQNGQIQDLDTPGHSSYALSINDAGQIVGTRASANTIYLGANAHAFVYREGRMLDLNNQVVNGSGWTLTTAAGINNQGQICGSGTVNGQPRAFLLTPQ